MFFLANGESALGSGKTRNAAASAAQSKRAYPEMIRAVVVLSVLAKPEGFQWQTNLVKRLERATTPSKNGKSTANKFAKAIKERKSALLREVQPKLPGHFTGLHKLTLSEVAVLFALDLPAKATAELESCESYAAVRGALIRFGWDLPVDTAQIFTLRKETVTSSPIVDPEHLAKWVSDNVRGNPCPLIVVAEAGHGASNALRTLALWSGDDRTFLHVVPPLSADDDKQYTVREADILRLLLNELKPNTEAPRLSATAQEVFEALKAAGTSVVVHNTHLVQPSGHNRMLAIWDVADQRDAKPLRTKDRLPAETDRPTVILHYPIGPHPNRAQLPKPPKLEGRSLRPKVIYEPPGIGPDRVGEVLDDMMAWFDRHYSLGHRSVRGKQAPGRTRLRRQVHRLDRSGRVITRSALFYRAAALVDPRGLPEGDPTLNLIPLARGARLAFAELGVLHTDVMSLARGMAPRARAALRMVSTSRHWLTKSMMDDLIRELGGHAPCSWEDIKDLVNDGTYGLATFVELDGHIQADRVRASMPVKSAVQDEWRRTDPLRYALVHNALGRVLLRISETRDVRASRERHQLEYSYEAPPEGPRNVFALEAIRYAKRAAEAHSEFHIQCKHTIRSAHLLLDTKAHGAFITSASENHALSRVYGRYETVLELMHMLSEGNEAHTPSPMLPEQARPSYHETVGLARFGCLELDLAWEAFMRGAQDPEASPDSQVQCLLHGASVATAAHSFSAAGACLTAARMLADTTTCAETARTRAAVRMGNFVRERGDPVHAIRIMQVAINHEDPTPVDGDRALAYVDTLIDAVDTDPRNRIFLEDITLICNANSKKLARDQYAYEAARFDVRKARNLCRLGLAHAAENLLDGIGLNFLRTNGSPRLHLEWCLAGGEALIGQGDFEWAYVGYLEAGLHLAELSGHRYYIRQFANAATRALNGMQGRLLPLQGETRSDRIARITAYLQREHHHTHSIGRRDWDPRALTLRASAERRGTFMRKSMETEKRTRYPEHGHDLTRPFLHIESTAALMTDPDFVKERLTVCTRLLPNQLSGSIAFSSLGPEDTERFAFPSKLVPVPDKGFQKVAGK